MTKPKTLLEVFTGQESDGTVGEYTRRLRRRKGWTLLELAAETGLSYSHLSRLENDKNLPSPATVVTLARVLDGDLDQMLVRSRCLPEEILGRLIRRSDAGEALRRTAGNEPDSGCPFLAAFGFGRSGQHIDLFLCSMCGKPFDFDLSGHQRRPRMGARRYCSTECRAEGRRLDNLASWHRNKSRWRGSKHIEEEGVQ